MDYSIRETLKKLRKGMIYSEELGIWIRPDQNVEEVKKLTKRIANDFLDKKGDFKCPR